MREITLTEESLKELLTIAYRFGQARGLNDTLIIRGYEVEPSEAMDKVIDRIVKTA